MRVVRTGILAALAVLLVVSAAQAALEVPALSQAHRFFTQGAEAEAATEPAVEPEVSGVAAPLLPHVGRAAPGRTASAAAEAERPALQAAARSAAAAVVPVSL